MAAASLAQPRPLKLPGPRPPSRALQVQWVLRPCPQLFPTLALEASSSFLGKKQCSHADWRRPRHVGVETHRGGREGGAFEQPTSSRPEPAQRALRVEVLKAEVSAAARCLVGQEGRLCSAPWCPFSLAGISQKPILSKKTTLLTRRPCRVTCLPQWSLPCTCLTWRARTSKPTSWRSYCKPGGRR